MYSTVTLLSRCGQCSDFVRGYRYATYGYWIALAKTTAWPTETEPPAPSPLLEELPELLGFVWVHKCCPAIENDEGLLKTQTNSYEEYVGSLEPVWLKRAKAHRAFVEATLLPNTIGSSSSYRMVAICTQLSFVGGFNTASLVYQPGLYVAASNVLSYTLDWVGTHEPVHGSVGASQHIRVVREF